MQRATREARQRRQEIGKTLDQLINAHPANSQIRAAAEGAQYRTDADRQVLDAAEQYFPDEVRAYRDAWDAHGQAIAREEASWIDWLEATGRMSKESADATRAPGAGHGDIYSTLEEPPTAPVPVEAPSAHT